MRRLTGLRLAAPLLLLLLSTCDAAPPPPSRTPVVPLLDLPSPAPRVAVDLADPDETARIAAALEAAGYSPRDDAETRLSDRPLAGGTMYAVAPWALVAHPRVERFDLSLAEAEAILDGRVADWSALDPAAQPLPLTLYVAEEAAGWLARTHRPSSRPGSPPSLPLAEVLARVAAEPGAVGLVPFAAPVLGVLALTVDGHDPYRDPATGAPLAGRRWVAARDAAERARLAALAGWEVAPPYDPAGVLATGELIPARCVQSRLVELGHDAMYEAIGPLIAAADYAIAPWEPSVVEDTPTPCVRTFILQAAPEAVAATARAGFDLAFTVGNHLGDCWAGCAATEAVRSTVATFRAHGMATAGAGDDLAEAAAPHFAEVNGVRLAFLAYDDIAAEFYGAGASYAGTNPLDLDRLAADVRTARAQADHVIVGCSWGVEYEADPSSRQREAAHIAIEAGASLVIGNHPHWVQATERIGDGWVAYGLGNMVFDQDWSVETQQGAILEAGFTRERLLGVRLRPVVIRDRYRPELVSPASEEGRAILGRIQAAADRLSGD